jgi:phosphate acetyltransferase
MPRYVYVMAVESGTGKSAVVLGLADVLSRRAGRLAVFRPLIAAADPPDPDIELVRRRYGLAQTHAQSYAQSYALTPDDLHDMNGRGGYDRLLSRVLDRCAAVSEGADVALVEGSDFTSASLPVELDLNVDTARNLAAPVLLIVGGRGHTATQVLDAARQGVTVLTDRGCTVLGVMCNRVARTKWSSCEQGCRTPSATCRAACCRRCRCCRRRPSPRLPRGCRRRRSWRLQRRVRSPAWSSGRWGCRRSSSGSQTATS